LAVPEVDAETDESFRYPNVAQELICHSSLIAQALVDGGLVAKKIVQHQVDSSEDEHESPHTAEPENREDEEAEEIEQPK